MDAHYSYYGWRTRIGLIIPDRNVVMEPEFNRMAPTGVSIHASRVLGQGRASAEIYKQMAEASIEAARQLLPAEPDVLAYGCTSGSILGGDEEITQQLREVTRGIPVVTTATAVAEALRALGLKRVAVATPYVDFVNEAERQYLEERGFEVSRILGLNFGAEEHQRRTISQQPPGVAYRIGKEVCTPDADGLFISCTNFTTVPIIDQLESELSRPVVTSNQATLWAALRRAGCKDRLQGLGRLLKEL